MRSLARLSTHFSVLVQVILTCRPHRLAPAWRECRVLCLFDPVSCSLDPLELVRTRLSLASEFGKNAPYNGIIDCFRRTVRTEGYRGLYKGVRR